METRKFVIISIPLLILLLSSCYNENKHVAVKPDHLFSEAMMIDIMTDVQIAEGTITYNRVIRTEDDFKEAYYNQIFIHYNITSRDLMQNLNYYNSQPAIMEKIIEKVIDNMNQALGNVQLKVKEERIADSLRKIELLKEENRLKDSLSINN